MKNFIHFFLVLLILVSPKYCRAQESKNTSIPDISVNVKSLIDSLNKSITSHYIFPEKALKISRYLEGQFNKGAYNEIKDPSNLAYKLITDIRKVNFDSHLNISYNPEEPKFFPAEKKEDIYQQENFEKENNFKFKKLEIFPGNIGYLQFNGFTSSIIEAKPTLNAAMNFLKNVNTLIIDLRYNGGGSPEMVNQVQSYFYKERVHMVDFVNTFDPDTVSFYTDPKSTNELSLSMPIYILTSKNTFSGAEDFTYALQTRKRAIVVGDTSGGGAHAAIQFVIGQGFTARIPFSRPINPITLTDWEGIGVVPDIFVPASQALVKAQEIIYQDLLRQAKNEKNKRVIQWALNELLARTSERFTILHTEKYLGTFTGGINFFSENGSIFCKNPERGGSDTFKLHPVNDHIFILDENAQVEFVKDSKDDFSSIKLLWADGNVTEKQRQ